MTLIKNSPQTVLQYLPITSADEKWGIVCTTVGYHDVPKNSVYPLAGHPASYSFAKSKGRILNEYQLIYITQGSGEFASASCRLTKVEAGTMLLLFPGEWHSYSPNKSTGWKEWWVGFSGTNIDVRIMEGFFSKSEPVLKIGISEGIINCYQEIITLAGEEKIGFQQLISGIVSHILGSVYFKKSNSVYESNPVVESINRAREIMRDNIENNISPEQIAQTLNMGYTWFRRTFKEYVGISPAQFQLQIRHNKAKELLFNSPLPISEIAFTLGFESTSQFSNFFKTREGVNAREYRKKSLPSAVESPDQ